MKKLIPVLEKVLSEAKVEAAVTVRTPAAELSALPSVVANKAQLSKVCSTTHCLRTVSRQFDGISTLHRCLIILLNSVLCTM